MKVTALIPDELINDVKFYSKGKNITESIIIALSEYTKLKKVMSLNELIKKKPLLFKKNISAQKIRKLNRNDIR